MDPTKASFGLVDGACGYGPLSKDGNGSIWPFWNTASISSEFKGAANGNKGGCGMCLQVTCADAKCKPGAAPVVLTVVDECPTCAPDQINMHVSVFSDYLASPGDGRVAIRYAPVPCAPVANLSVRVTDVRSSAGGYVRLVPMAVAGDGTVSSIQVRPTGTDAWIAGKNN